MSDTRERFDKIALDAKNNLQDHLLFAVGASATDTATLMKKVDTVFGEIREFCETQTNAARAEQHRKVALDAALYEAAKRTPFRSAFHIIKVLAQPSQQRSPSYRYRVYRRNLEKDEAMERGNPGIKIGTFTTRDAARLRIQELAKTCSEYMIFE